MTARDLRDLCLALLVLCVVLYVSGCAAGTRHANGDITCFATGNAAWSYCEPAVPLRMSVDPVPITPVTQPGCVVCQGGAEAGSTLVSWQSGLAVILGVVLKAIVF